MWVPLTNVSSPSSALLAPGWSVDGPDRANANQTVNLLIGQEALGRQDVTRVGTDSRRGTRHRRARPGEARRRRRPPLRIGIPLSQMGMGGRLGDGEYGRDAGVGRLENPRPFVAVAF